MIAAPKTKSGTPGAVETCVERSGRYSTKTRFPGFALKALTA